MDVNENIHPTEQPDSSPSASARAREVGTEQDTLDKGIAQVIKEFISPAQAQDPSVVERASDAVRAGFKESTGKDFPMQDRQ
ncbi:hypothetical protein I312_101922 [Cryptococcus bacillisporus CA1280]|uniref:Uncharacterized protein n=2 Tax=Cryptococcus gattii TaxID=552467 RepID=A0A0D0VPA3_CRYGA|nr:hypothetical protein I312_02726 [Cryptococcus bacillisporus CA1280]KIR69413.1 hypothetical protein I314_00524 [Cryptococcus bacillisporus CA1873]|eukprot:KIR69413.1 hypothetical protein I314_00524 [Cryptococcus gattii CA1873]